jgi:hypothetical protein
MYIVLLLIAGALGATYRCGQIVEADRAYNLARSTGTESVAKSDQITKEDVAQSSASFSAVRFWNNVAFALGATAVVIVLLNLASLVVLRAPSSIDSSP